MFLYADFVGAIKIPRFDSVNSLGGSTAPKQTVMPDDHSSLVPLLPIPNRTVKRARADDSADPRVKVGHRQAFILETPVDHRSTGVFLLCVVTPISNGICVFRNT
jgi:hypothetical protein